jgi:hypothetical protein
MPSLVISTLCLLGYVSSSLSASTMPEYCFASWATLPLGLLCFLGCFASWATLPLGLLCLLGYISTLSALTMPVYCYASWAALPLGLYLIDIVCFDNAGILLCLLACFDMLLLGLCLIDIVFFDNAGILLCLLDCAITGHLFVCQILSYVNMSNRDTLWDRIW